MILKHWILAALIAFAVIGSLRHANAQAPVNCSTSFLTYASATHKYTCGSAAITYSGINVTFLGTPTATFGYESIGALQANAASKVVLSQQDAATSAVTAFGANTSTFGILQLRVAKSNGGTTNMASVTGSGFTPVSTTGIVGTTTNDSANAGSVGEVISCSLATGSSVTLSTNTTANVCNVSLTAGDWDCRGTTAYTFAASTSYTNIIGGTSGTSATLGAQGTFFDFETPAAVPTATADQTWVVPTTRQLLSGTTTTYLVARATFTVSTLKAYGNLDCRRMR